MAEQHRPGEGSMGEWGLEAFGRVTPPRGLLIATLYQIRRYHHLAGCPARGKVEGRARQQGYWVILREGTHLWMMHLTHSHSACGYRGALIPLVGAQNLPESCRHALGLHISPPPLHRSQWLLGLLLKNSSCSWLTLTSQAAV